MSHFLSQKSGVYDFELIIDTGIFSKDIILKTAYNFLDKGYFFFRLNADGNILLEFKKKDGVMQESETIIGEFSDGLLDVYLRDKLEKDNKVIRETIVNRAINGPLDLENFVSLDVEAKKNNEIDFDKDIDDILAEIENDPELQIDEEEIESILKEIEAESKKETSKPQVKVDIGAVASIKDKFKK